MQIKYNTEFKRWEVYNDNPVIRNKEPQPAFVSAREIECERYVKFAYGVTVTQ